MGTPLLMGPAEREALRDLCERAAVAPVDMRTLRARLATVEGKADHMRQMTAQSVYLPDDHPVTFSIETGHPAGVARHMSISIQREGRAPHPEVVWAVAEELGFAFVPDFCVVYPEHLLGHGFAINLVQPVGIGILASADKLAADKAQGGA